MVIGLGKRRKNVIVNLSDIPPINLDNKEFLLEDRDYIKNYIKDKIKDDFIILIGDISIIRDIERVVYSGIDKNINDENINVKNDEKDDFVLIMGGKCNLYLAKKTDLLKKRITVWGDIDEKTFDKVMLVNIVSTTHNDMDEIVWDYVVKRESDNEIDEQNFYEEFSEDVLTNVLQM